MQRTNHINGWEAFVQVRQDVEGTVLTTGGGLRTHGLSNCLCLILSDGGHRYGMLHANPTHENTAQWIADLREQVHATEAVIAGANAAVQSGERRAALAAALHGLAIVDETRNQWLAGVDGVTPGDYGGGPVGCVAVSATTGEYMFGMFEFAASVHVPASLAAPRARPRRRGKGGRCVIL